MFPLLGRVVPSTVGALNSIDTIVVGAGAAGCVVARRLVDDGHRVALFEAGPGRPIPEALTTIDTLEALAVPEWLWPDARLADSGGDYLLGRGLGGGSAVNSMVLMTGNRADYDRWDEQSGASGWRWSALEPWFEQVTQVLGVATAELGPLARAFGEAAVDHGHPLAPPSAVPDGRGFGPASLACVDLVRTSAADAFLPVKGVGELGEGDQAKGLSVKPDRTVRRVLFDGDRANAVELSDGSVVRSGRVVLCAGALGSPAVLARSGLISAPFPLADHPSFVFPVSLRPGHRVAEGRPTAPISGLLRWRADDPAGTTRVIDVGALVMDHTGRGPVGRANGAIIVSLFGARSVGRFRLAGDGFEIESAGLDDGRDQRRLIAAVRHASDVLAGPQLGAVADGVFLDEVGTPLEAMTSWSDAEMLAWLLAHPGPVHHPAASLPLGLGPRSVVGLDGAVAGRSGLYVADASVLPHLPAANPQLPVMAVAARIAAGIA